MNRKVVVRQNGYKDCGPSCLLSIMRHYGYDVSHEEVSYVLKTNLDGTNAYNIINGSKSFGFDGYGIHYTIDEIINKKVTFPIICHVLKNNMYHFIVIYEVKEKYLIVMDPASNNNRLYIDEFKDIYLNTSIVIYPIKKFNKIEKHKELYDFIIDYILIEKNKAIKIIILSLITIFISLFSNYYLLICIDYILPNYKYNLLLSISSVFLLSLVVKNILDYIRNKYQNDIEKNISIYLNNDIIRKYFNLPYHFFKSKSAGESISRLNDLDTFKNYSSQIILSISTDAILIVISMIILLIINNKIFIIYILELIFYYLIVLIFKRKLNIKNENILISESEYNKSLNESIYGYENNKNINMINEVLKKLEIKKISYLNNQIIYKNSINKQNLLKEIISSIFYVFTIFIAVISINNNTMSLGEFILFNTIVYYFVEPIKNIIDISINMDYIKNIYNRINDLLLIKDNKKYSDNYILSGDIHIRNLSYSHDGINNTLSNVNISINYGDKFLIYGDSGIGKSTIIKILLKYLKEYNGEIYIDKYNLKDISDNNISNNFTYVSQNSYINNDTLRNNIIYDRNISLEEYEKVINICNLNKLRNSSKLRNDLMIEDDGFNISGGEKQKIILARSILNDFNYLILDEALSEVGVLEEKEIINKIIYTFKDKTIIFISHREEIINMFDLKYKLERRENNV